MAKKSEHSSKPQATAPTPNKYTLDELESDIGHCHHLIDMAVNMLCGNYLNDEKTAREQTETLAWVARDLLEDMSKKIEAGGGRPRV